MSSTPSTVSTNSPPTAALAPHDVAPRLETPSSASRRSSSRSEAALCRRFGHSTVPPHTSSDPAKPWMKTIGSPGTGCHDTEDGFANGTETVDDPSSLEIVTPADVAYAIDFPSGDQVGS